MRDRAWFYLAKIRYQRGYLAEAEESLAKIERKLPPQLEEERGLLLAQLLMLRSDYAGAAGTLSGLSLKGTGARYVRYNLGIALLKSGESKRGTQLLDDVGKESAPTEEYRSLRDRANVALGFSALSENRPKDARTYLERVRLAEPAVEQGAARLRLGRRRARRSRSSRSCRGRSWPTATSARPRSSRRRSRFPTPTPSSAPTARRCSATRRRSPPTSAKAPS